MFSYHRGERAVQERAGLTDQAEFSAGAISRTIPEVAARFLAEQPMLVVGAADQRGRMWCSLLTGRSGFLRPFDERTLDVAAAPHGDDPLAEALKAGSAKIGALAIEPATRRRMRLNGVSQPTHDGLRITADQVYANCPKYIQKRDPDVEPFLESIPRTSRSTELTVRQRELLDRTDSFFIATSNDTGDADASHRGGNPGFLQATSPSRLVWPDYTGNAMFMTLGNIQLNSRAGLLVPDWDIGGLLQITGSARVVWDVESPGAQRVVEFEVAEVVESSATGPVARGRVQYSRFNPPVTPFPHLMGVLG